jgi:hypothetical protein
MSPKTAKIAHKTAHFRTLRTGRFAFGSNQGHTLAMAPLAEKLDPVTLSLLNAPVDDEPLTEEDIKDIEASEEDIRCGRVISLEQLAQNLGIDLDKQT